MHTSRGLNRVTHLLTKMYYQERMRIICQDYDPKFLCREWKLIFIMDLIYDCTKTMG